MEIQYANHQLAEGLHHPIIRVAITNGEATTWIIKPVCADPQMVNFQFTAFDLTDQVWFHTSDEETIQERNCVVIPHEVYVKATQAQVASPTPKAEEVKVIKREGKRTIRLGQTVQVQPKMVKGTRKITGVVKKLDSLNNVTVGDGINLYTVTCEWVHVPNQGGK